MNAIIKCLTSCLIYISLLGIPSQATCTPDPDSATPVPVDSSITNALSLINNQLKGPLKIFGQDLDLDSSNSASYTQMQYDCVDENFCPCGTTSESVSGTDTYTLTLNASFNAGSIGPTSSSIGGYLVVFSATATATITGTATITADVTGSEDCNEGTMHYTIYGTGNLNGNATGTANASFTVSNRDGSDPTTYGVTGTAQGLENWTLAVQASDSGSASGTAAFVSGSLTYTFTLSPLGSFTYTQDSYGFGF